jgi:hypothetical protein
MESQHEDTEDEFPLEVSPVSLDEITRRQGKVPKTWDELRRPGLFGTDEEVDELVAETYRLRRLGFPPS